MMLKIVKIWGGEILKKFISIITKIVLILSICLAFIINIPSFADVGGIQRYHSGSSSSSSHSGSSYSGSSSSGLIIAPGGSLSFGGIIVLVIIFAIYYYMKKHGGINLNNVHSRV